MKKLFILMLLIGIGSTVFAQSAESTIELTDNYTTDHLHLKYDYNLMTIDIDDRPFLFRLKAYHDAISGINLQKCSLFHCICFSFDLSIR